MRKVEKHDSKYYTAVRLFKDDVEDIYSLVKKTCCHGSGKTSHVGSG